MAPYLYLDAETAPIVDAAQYLTAESIDAPSNYKDPDKIASYIAREQRKRLDKCGTDIDLARIVALGWMFDGEIEPGVMTCRNEDEERAALIKLWDDITGALATARLITFNGHAFDLPLIMRRSDYLDVPYRELNLDRYRSPHLDLLLHLTHRGAIKGKSLTFYARRFGLVNEAPEIDGSDIARLVEENTPAAWSQIVGHNRADLLLMADLCARLHLVGARPPAEPDDPNPF